MQTQSPNRVTTTWAVTALGCGLLLVGCASSSPSANDREEVPMAERVLEHTVTVAAPPDVVFDSWTTNAGVRTFFAPDSEVELEEGAPYELYFSKEAPEGSRGSEGCVIVSYQPGERLMFTWNFPPNLPIRDERTRVELTFESLPPHSTRVTLRQTGWRAGDAWEKGYAYFDKAWASVLERLRRRFLEGPIDWSTL